MCKVINHITLYIFTYAIRQLWRISKLFDAIALRLWKWNRRKIKNIQILFIVTSEFRITDFLIFSLNYILADCMNLMLKKIFIWLLHLAPGKFIKITGSICFREHKILQWWVALFIENNNHNFLPARIYAEQRLFYYHSCNLIFIW